MNSLELLNKISRFRKTADAAKLRGDVAEAQKWEDAIQAANEIMQRRKDARAAWEYKGGDTDHMNMMRALRHQR